ncbi:ligase-associated DNA damage response endonuclease PdeM [Mesobaculum littorinae]|uniref:Ligase-associated DNA damage response endonuclease PdeM n=1 Tax=Mesobaculum littorinae TaxID=2486419 RepID=A0A438AIT2_9RHOB|nr:ligase-associated DNA damage response endonuclease PdeM [Mesobaculum littorinae]RVV98507.1 ligase-associated DNA damage response endonuclease PdeM [Mesobaculum littorinae]
MNGFSFTLRGARLVATGSGALLWPEAGLMAVSDLHLGKSERWARRRGTLLPPYEVQDTLARLAADIARHAPALVLCLGDSFDDDAAAVAVAPAVTDPLARMQAGRRWLWITGNHDADTAGPGGETAGEAQLGPLTFRHIAASEAEGEVSGHYHPKARVALRGRSLSRPCFLFDAARLILPAYGTYTGGLRWTDPVLQNLMGDEACAVLTGPTPHAFPLPRHQARRRA